MSKVFISYRRSDTQMAAGRLRESLSSRFGNDAIFRDKDSIAGGTDWINAIEQNLKQDAVVLVLIGRDWLAARNDAGARRLDDPEDWNRLEIEHSLRLARTVVPVLVDNAVMPGAAELPDSLKPLARTNAVKLRDDDWDADIERLARVLTQHGVADARAGSPAPAKSRAGLTAAVVAVLLAAIGAGAWVYSASQGPAASVSGSWAMSHFNEDGTKQLGSLTLEQKGRTVTGAVVWARGATRDISNGVIEGSTVEFEAVGPRGAKRVYRGEVDSTGNLIQGQAKGGSSSQASWNAVRQSSAK
jgi:hypothetical protein